MDGDGPGQFEWQLLSTQVDPATGFKHPALRLQHLGNAAQETHTGESWGEGWDELVSGGGGRGGLIIKHAGFHDK